MLQDGVEDVYMFLDDQEGGSDAMTEREELPTGVVTMLTRCYSPSCGDGDTCYAFACPRKVCQTCANISLVILMVVVFQLGQLNHGPCNRPNGGTQCGQGMDSHSRRGCSQVSSKERDQSTNVC